MHITLFTFLPYNLYIITLQMKIGQLHFFSSNVVFIINRNQIFYAFLQIELNISCLSIVKRSNIFMVEIMLINEQLQFSFVKDYSLYMVNLLYKDFTSYNFYKWYKVISWRIINSNLNMFITLSQIQTECLLTNRVCMFISHIRTNNSLIAEL